MGALLQKLLIDVLFAKGNATLKQIDDIAPTYNEYYYNQLNKLINENKGTAFGKKYNYSNINNMVTMLRAYTYLSNKKTLPISNV